MCGGEDLLPLPARESVPATDDDLPLITRFVHISDTHVIDEESPARFIGAQALTRSAWRPWEAASTQILDGILRTTNNFHSSGRTVDFLISTGDGCDNAQWNELAWMLDVFDGQAIDPLSGPDDRDPAARPSQELDPHAPFTARGLYRQDTHGEAPSIPWYTVFGNHDTYAVGLFPIIEDVTGERTAPLTLPLRPGILLPSVFRSTGSYANGKVTPAFTGPPTIGQPAVFVEPRPQRAFYTRREYIQSMFTTLTDPPGHGFQHPDSAPAWYATVPVPGIRLIGLDTTDHPVMLPGRIYLEGGISELQHRFLIEQLERAADLGEQVIVASHHPSESLITSFGSTLTAEAFVALLNAYPQVILHLAGHRHRNRVIDHGGYLEIETCSTLDWPQEGRWIEVYRDPETRETIIAYGMFSHVDDRWTAEAEDPLRDLRIDARRLAREDAKSGVQRHVHTESPTVAPGLPIDREGVARLPSMLTATATVPPHREDN